MCGSTRRSVSVVVFSPRASVKSSLSVENRSCTLLSYSNCKTQHHECRGRDCLHLISTASGLREISYIYCPPTKLQESNSFSRDCPSVSHSVHGEGSDVIITHDALDLSIQEPPPGPTRWTWDPTVQAPPTSPPVPSILGDIWWPRTGDLFLTCSPEDPSPTSPDIWWPRLETCSKLYT